MADEILKMHKLATRNGCVAIFLFIACVWGAVQEIYTGIQNREPLYISLAEYQDERPGKYWLHLTQCQLDVENSVTRRDSDNKVTGVYTPLRVPGKAGKSAVVLLDKSPGGTGGPTDVEGLVQVGYNLKDSDRELIEGAVKDLSPDYIVLRRGDKPSMAGGATLLLLAIVIAAVWRNELRKT